MISLFICDKINMVIKMVYLDYSATTPVDKEVLETFNKVCMEYPGNSNSLHSLGVKSKELEDYDYDCDIIADKLEKKYGNNIQNYSAKDVKIVKFTN